MDHLLLIHGFGNGCTAHDLQDILLKLFKDKNVEKLWLDPYRENRAVAMFKENLDVYELSELSAHALLGEIVQPTNKIFIRAYGTLKFAAKDKLRIMFAKKKNQLNIEKCNDLEDDCFEVFFKEGWEAVLAVCNKEWILEKNKLTVIPYFNCFIEPYECQFERLSRKINTSTAIDSEMAAAGNLHIDDLSVLENYGLSRKQEHNNIVQNKMDAFSSEAERTANMLSSDIKTIYICYSQNVIPLMLSLLNFEKALKGLKFHSLVQVTLESCKIKIKGPASLVQRLHDILTPKQYKFTKSQVLKKFLAIKKIQQDIKTHFENSDYHLFLEMCDNQTNLIVVDGKGNKGTFQEFMSQLVTEKTFLYLSRSDLDENKELLEYIENFNKTNSHSQIFNEDGNILILILFYQDKLITSIASDITKVLNEKVTIQITFQSRFYIWLLDAMTFTKAAQKIFPDVSIAINIDNHDINLNGYERQIDVLNKILVDQNEKITLNCVDETLFSDEKLLIKLKKIVEELGYHVDIIGNENLKIVICNKNGNVDYLENLVGKLIMKKTTYSFKNNTHLEQLAADINSKFQSFHVFAEEKNLILFAFQGYDKEDIDKFILSQNLGEFNVTQHQLAHINEVENESEQETKIPKSVLPVCGRKQKIGEQKLTILPNFDCFQVSLDEETETLSPNMKSVYKVIESETASTSQSYNDQIYLELIDSSARQQGHHAKNTESTDIFENIEKLTLQDLTAETFEKFSLIHYEQSIIPLILKHLNIEKALKETKFPSKVEVTTTSINIEGSSSFVKKIHHMLSEKTFKSTKLSETSKRFLGFEKIQQEIKKFIKISGSHLVLDETGEDIKLIVIDNQGNESTVQEFISQLVTEKNCLSSKNLIRNKELLEYIENFNSTNPHGQIFIEDGNVLLLSLFYQSELMDSVASEIQKFSTTDEGDKKSLVIKKVKVKINFQNKYFLWLLDVLKFQTAAETNFPGLTVTIEIDNKDIIFRGYANQITMIKKILMDHSEEIAFDHHEEMLFSDETFLIKLKKVVDGIGYHIVITDSDNPRMIIQDCIGQIEFLERIVGKLVLKQTTFTFKNILQLEELAADINSKYQLFHTVAEKREFKLTLFAFQGYNNDDMCNLNQYILSQNLGEFNITQHQSAHNDEVKNENEQSKISIFPCEPQLLAYCEKFLKSDILDLQRFDESKRTLIVFGQDEIEIYYTFSHMLNFIEERLTELIKKIIGKKFRLEFPGFKNFMDSESGQELIEFISQKYECLIEFPEFKDQQSQFQEYVTPKSSYSRKDYNSVLLKTAKLRGLNFHLVQGDINNMNLDMRVEFVPSNEAECSISTQASSKHCAHYVINLPNWRVPKGEAVQDFYAILREGLKENVNIMFQQAARISCYKIGISTSQLHDSKYPFPLDVIAEAVVGQSLILKESLAQDFKMFDVVICELTNSDVFSKFLYFLNENGFHISQPDEDCRSDFMPSVTNLLNSDCKARTKTDVLDISTTYMGIKSELQKRCPTKEEHQKNSILHKIRNWWYNENEGFQHSASTGDIITTNNTIPSLQIKIWGMLEDKIHQAYLSLKSELEHLMTKNKEFLKLDKAQLTLFENIKHNLVNLSVKIIFTKNLEQKVKKCTNCLEKKGKKNKPCQKCKDQTIMVVTSSTVQIQGLSKQNVKDFKEMLTDKASASKQSTSIDEYSTAEDLVDKKKSPANGSEAELEENLLLDSTKGKYKTKGAECMEANEMTTSHLKEHSFCWMMETQGEEKDGSEASPQVTYTMIPEGLQQEVEQAYIENKGSLVKEDFNFNFGDMFVIMNKEKKGLIRSEVLNFKYVIGSPITWTTKENEKPQCIELSKSDKEFISIEKELTDKILIKLKTLQIYRVENFALYQRFKVKFQKLEGEPVRLCLWHQVSKEKNAKLVCEYGFHQHFSGMPSGHKNFGKGVSFSNDPRKCFTNASFQSNNVYYLFHANVMLGKSGPGRKKFHGTPEQQSATNEQKDVFMVFSDAQAYPRHLIVFTVE